MINPTIGRVVWFFPYDRQNGDQPQAAIVTYVWTDRMVNLVVFNPNGMPYQKTSVKLLQDDDGVPSQQDHAVWMPYQIATARKQEVVEVSESIAIDNDGNAVGGNTTNSC